MQQRPVTLGDVIEQFRSLLGTLTSAYLGLSLNA